MIRKKRKNSMQYDKIKKVPTKIKAATGLTSAQFEALATCFKYHWDEYYEHYTLEGKVRQRRTYTRKTTHLPHVYDKLLFILMYLKTNPMQEIYGIQYDMTQPQVNLWVHRLSEILRRTLKTLNQFPDRNSYRMIHLLSECEDVLIDGTERPIQRPMDDDRQKSCYSGKKSPQRKKQCTYLPQLENSMVKPDI